MSAILLQCRFIVNQTVLVQAYCNLHTLDQLNNCAALREDTPERLGA